MSNAVLAAEDVAKLVERYLEKRQPAGYRILVDASGVKVDADGWWEVPIRPSKEDAPSHEWIGLSSEAAEEIDVAEGVHVLFV